MSIDDPFEPDRLRALSRELAASFRHEQAAEALEKINRRTIEDDVLLASCLRRIRSPRNVSALLSPYLNAEQRHPGVLTEAAMLLGNRPRDAERLFRRALATDPDYIEAIHGLAWLLELGARPPSNSTHGRAEARALLRRALELAPDDPEILQTQAFWLLYHGDPEAALPLFVRIAEQRSKPPWSETGNAFEAQVDVARVLVELGRLDEALDVIVAAAAAVGPEWLDSTNCQRLRLDTGFTPLHDNPRFVMLTEISTEGHSEAERLALAQERIARRLRPPSGPRPAEIFVEALRSNDRTRQLQALHEMTEVSRLREVELDHPSTDEWELMTRDGPPMDRVLAEPECLGAMIHTNDVCIRRALSELLGVLVASDRNEVVEIARPLVLTGLERWLDDEVEPVTGLLRELADEARGRLPEVADLLARKLNDASLTTDEFVLVVDALGPQGQLHHAELLRRFTNIEHNPSRAAVVRALCRLGDPLPERFRWLADPAWEVRCAVLEERGEQLVADDRYAVLAEWRKRDWTFRPAWDALEPQLDSSFIPEALTLTHDSDYALWAWDWLRRHTLTREQIASLLAAPFAVHPQIVPQRLAALLRSQLDTSHGLPECGTSHIAPSHVDALEPDICWRPIGGAIEAAGYLGWTSWRPWAIAKLTTADDWLTKMIAGALGGMGCPEDIPLLRRLFEIGSVYVQSRAALSLLLLGEEPNEELLGSHIRRELHTAWALRRLEGHVPRQLLEPVWVRLREWPHWIESKAEVHRLVMR
jgi:tetratricopeptide (TPR) repeat protein/HEAT repeat protein